MDSHLVRRLEVVETGRRRRWSVDRKRQIVEESFAAGATASSVARRHGISAAHLFAWRKAFRSGRLDGGPGDFVPLVMQHESADARRTDEVIEIVARNGRRLVVRANVNAALVTELLRAVERE